MNFIFAGFLWAAAVTQGQDIAGRAAMGETLRQNQTKNGETVIANQASATGYVVENSRGYNSWPFVQTLKGGRLVCAYSRGEKHSINEHCRGVYARVSDDGGKTWGAESQVVNMDNSGESAIGKGLDEKGAMLLWVRCLGPYWHHDLYRSEDGISFRKIAELRPDPMPMQITDVFAVPGVGLMSFWFAGRYRDLPENSWGILTSADNGKTWKQTVIESGLKKGDWPTEQSGVYLGDGKILAIGRCEIGGTHPDNCQFQLQSEDYGKTWKKFRTNIHDVQQSTPSLILDRESGMLTNYYYHRGIGTLKRRTVSVSAIWNHPQSWPEFTVVGKGSANAHHAGNVNAAGSGNMHYCTFYTGNPKQTDVVVVEVSAVNGQK